MGNTLSLPANVLADLTAAAAYAAASVCDPEVIRLACERMDRMRREMGQRTGETDIAVDLIRELRDEE